MTDQRQRPVRQRGGVHLSPGEAPPQTRAERRRNRPKHSTAWEFFVIAAIALSLSFLVKTFLVQPFSIPSESMERTLDVGDRILVSKLSGAQDVKRGDVVVFEQPDTWGPSETPAQNPIRKAVGDVLSWVGVLPAGGEHLVKRVIGLPGDRVECDQRCAAGEADLKVNGVRLDESSFLSDEKAGLNAPFSITVPKDKFWVMGDNRSHSGDSRMHDDGTGETGSVPFADITGPVVSVAWPIGRIQSVDAHPAVFAKVPNP